MAATAKPMYYEGQEFENPNDPTAPVLVYRKGKFVTKEADQQGVGGAAQSTLDDAKTMLSDLDATKKSVKGFWDGGLGLGTNTGMIGAIEGGDKGVWKGLPGTSGYNLNRDLDTIKARIAFANLAKMRAQSPTGGALGAVSDKEDALLAATEGNLDVGLPAGQLRQNIDRVRQATIRRNPGVDPTNPLDLSGGQPRDHIPRGAYYRDPDGNIRRNDNGDNGNPIIQPAPGATAPSAATGGWSVKRVN